ncbi:hypothetical protein LTR78_000244 [Recurvomyces mirabilis]|uniref:Nucleoporin POM34 n=1 Tax=Recurvomyces mirabilis TaxID=574656 RepID=A0AAE0WXP1_9PEZI|nr:hypothetical protein LTR78_000244 [Recurvomyces mirabilis]KAK5161900.1 hypothetical protein LTS14_000245 [Recurvomyces mirabilis]
MSTTALVQRAAHTLTPASNRNGSTNLNTASALTTATSILPKLSLTPSKSAGTVSSPQKPATPSQQPSPAISTPGQWQHPRMQEVIRRQNANRFDASNMRVIGLNVGFMVASIFIPHLAWNILPHPWILAAEPYSSYFLYLLRAFFTLNVVLAFAPLFRPKDNCDDVPLNPSQRQLMGLPPMSRPATPQEEAQYVTPPRYSRSATPQSNNSLRAQASGSPLSGRGMGTPMDGSQLRRSFSGSPRPSPLGTPTGQNSRSSFGRNSPLSTPEFDAAGSISTPTKSNKASVSLNSKWLYEKGRASPRSSFSGLGGFGGGGSVFN